MPLFFYLTPIFALLYGVVLLGERITVPAIVGLSQTIGGAKITLRRDGAVPEPPRSERKTRDATPIVRGTDAVEAIALL